MKLSKTLHVALRNKTMKVNLLSSMDTITEDHCHHQLKKKDDVQTQQWDAWEEFFCSAAQFPFMSFLLHFY